MRVAHLALPLFNIEEVIHLVGGPPPLYNVGIVDVLQVRTNCHFVLLVVLIDEALIAAHRGERYPRLLVEAPAIELLAELLGVELRLHLGVRVLVILVIHSRIAATVRAGARP